MKSQIKKIAIAIAMIVTFCGCISAQIAPYEIAVKNDNNEWVAGNWKKIILPNGNVLPFSSISSKYNYKDVNISGIGGNTVCLKLVDTTLSHNTIPVWRWTIGQDSDTTTISNIDTAYYDLPKDNTSFIYITAYYDVNDVNKFVRFPIWSKFLSPVFELTDTINGSKNTNVNLTLADFGLTIEQDQGASLTAYYNTIKWYRDGLVIHEGTGLDTIYAVDSTGNYSVEVEVLYFTKSSIIGDTTTKAFSKWIFSDSVYVDMAIVNSYVDYSLENSIFNIYPNPTTDYLYLSIETEFRVFSITGQEMLRGVGNKIDVSMFNKGVYIIKTSDVTKKFLVQ